MEKLEEPIAVETRTKIINGGQTGADQAALNVALQCALAYLENEIEVTWVCDNAGCPGEYGKSTTANCWRVYYGQRGCEPVHTGGNSPYILIEKETHRLLGRGIESSE